MSINLLSNKSVSNKNSELKSMICDIVNEVVVKSSLADFIVMKTKYFSVEIFVGFQTLY